MEFQTKGRGADQSCNNVVIVQNFRGVDSGAEPGRQLLTMCREEEKRFLGGVEGVGGHYS